MSYQQRKVDRGHEDSLNYEGAVEMKTTSGMRMTYKLRTTSKMRIALLINRTSNTKTTSR